MQQMQHKKVLVFLAVYNGAKYLKDQIISILNQKSVSVFILIRDDGSSDGSLELCREMVSRYDNINIIQDNEPTGTPAGCFYKLMSSVNNVSDFDYYAFADQDDIWCSNKLQAAINKLNSSHDGYSSNLIAFDSQKGRAWVVNKSAVQTDVDYYFQGASAGCTYVINRNAFSVIVRCIRGVDFERLKALSHDWFIYAVLRSENLRWVHDEAAFIFYRQHQNNNYGDKKGLQLFLMKYSLLRNGWYRRHILEMLDILSHNEKSKQISNFFTDSNALQRLFAFKFAFRFRRKKIESIFLYLSILIGLI
jgi:rhamnosyltransferase